MSEFAGWEKVAANLESFIAGNDVELNDGQRASLIAVAKRLPNTGIIIADEVGMGKTRIATTVAKAVIEAGGRVAILVPSGLGYQWGDELRKSHVVGVRPILRSLWQYLQAWEDPQKPTPWFNENIVLISHAFCNWRLGANTEAWRWGLLPELYACWRRLQDGRFPRNYHRNGLLDDNWVKRAAKSIANAINSKSESHPGRQRMAELASRTHWPEALDGNEYVRNASLRPELEKAVGLGLGIFNLVIIDEAHKNRAQESGLNRLLEHLVLLADEGRRLAMTATPIELDVSQWKQMLERIGIKDGKVDAVISSYADVVQKVRKLPNDEQTRNGFCAAAGGFQSSLGQYMLRRDKREVDSVKDFAERSGNAHSHYRRLQEIIVPTAELSFSWKQAVCAAEALSFVTRGLDDEAAKRLRLTLGNGHGIAALMDESLRDENEDLDDHQATASDSDASEPDKRSQRIDWWKQIMGEAFQGGTETGSGEAALYDHPAIRAAVEVIEAVCSPKDGTQGEKVLVFGRFTKPMQALVRLLNTREMLRCFEAGMHWPQEKTHQNEKAAVEAELLKRGKGETLRQIDEWLSKQYRELENQRVSFRIRLRNVLSEHLAFLDEQNQELALPLLARPIQEIVIDDAPSDEAIIRAFNEIVVAASDQDKEAPTEDDAESSIAGSQLDEETLKRIKEEYGREEGGFARLMNGNTKPPTRRLLQLAFNREHSHPKVLVCQSVVGREGLNLHESCRTVILLHAEWNPGIVEQQIGRVDRINSLWEKKLKAAKPDTPADELPRIEIRPVIFQGTYDEHNWKVLMQRWDDLRAQLHGIVIPPSIESRVDPEIVRALNNAAPNFSPTKLLEACHVKQEGCDANISA